jgi:sugar/nucleoside kinase (ribokinase family)
VKLLAVGSIALDRLEGPFGAVTDELGGSALYFGLAAALIRPVELSAPVGGDAAAQVRRLFSGRPIDASAITVLDAPTYRWSARQVSGTNREVGSRDSIYDHWEPALPDGYGGWAFIGSMRPDRQAGAALALRGSAALLAGDSMRSYLASLPDEAKLLVEACTWFFANREELAALGGDPDQPDEFRRRWALEGLVVKAGPDGSEAWTSSGTLRLQPPAGFPVVDVTGAGDALAGGLLARWLETGARPEGLEDALAYGIGCASLAVSDIGLRGLAAATPADLESRVRAVLG